VNTAITGAGGILVPFDGAWTNLVEIMG